MTTKQTNTAAQHAAAREEWLALQAGPRYRERHAAYVKMAALALLLTESRS